MAGDIMNPVSFVVPKVSKTIRDSMAAEPGTLIYNTDDKLLYVSSTSVVGSTSWLKVTMS